MSTHEETYLTPQRLAVLEAVRESEAHLTARGILERARLKQPRLSYATVYNALSYLTRAGLIHELSLANAASRYDKRELSHGHAICEACGEVLDLDLPDMLPLVGETAAANGFVPAAATLVVYGRCRACREVGGGAQE